MTKRSAALLLLCSMLATGCAGWSPHRTQPLDSLPEYRLTLRVLPNDRRLQVAGTVRLAAATDAFTPIILSLSAGMDNLRVEVVEPVASAGLARLERVGDSGNNVKWIVRTQQPLPPGASILLRFSYTGNGNAAPMYYVGPEIAFASAWGTDWYPIVEGDSDKATGEVTVSVPAGWTVVTGGVRRSTLEQEAQGTFRSAILYPTYFSFTAAKYIVVHHNSAVPVTAYLLTHRKHIKQYLRGVEEILAVLTQEFGEFPFGNFALVEVPRELASQAGFNALAGAGLIVMNSRAFDAPDTKYLLEWLGHELSHQWFPHAVALRTPPGLYMEEALAQYGGLRTVESIGGPEAAKRLRTTGFEYDPIYSALAYFKLTGEGVDQPLADLQPKLEHRNLAYNKGSLVFDMLSREIGRTEFQQILHGITRQHRYQSITWPEFLQAIEVASGRTLDWFFEQWFGRSGAPDWQLAWRQEGDLLRGAITQAKPYYRAKLKVEVRGSEGQRLVHAVESRRGRVDFLFPVGFRVQSAVLDPDYELLRWTQEYRAAAESSRSKPTPGQ